MDLLSADGFIHSASFLCPTPGLPQEQQPPNARLFPLSSFPCSGSAAQKHRQVELRPTRLAVHRGGRRGRGLGGVGRGGGGIFTSSVAVQVQLHCG